MSSRPDLHRNVANAVSRNKNVFLFSNALSSGSGGSNSSVASPPSVTTTINPNQQQSTEVSPNNANNGSRSPTLSITPPRGISPTSSFRLQKSPIAAAAAAVSTSSVADGSISTSSSLLSAPSSASSSVVNASSSASGSAAAAAAAAAGTTTATGVNLAAFAGKKQALQIDARFPISSAVMSRHLSPFLQSQLNACDCVLVKNGHLLQENAWRLLYRRLEETKSDGESGPPVVALCDPAYDGGNCTAGMRGRAENPSSSSSSATATATVVLRDETAAGSGSGLATDDDKLLYFGTPVSTPVSQSPTGSVMNSAGVGATFPVPPPFHQDGSSSSSALNRKRNNNNDDDDDDDDQQLDVATATDSLKTQNDAAAAATDKSTAAAATAAQAIIIPPVVQLVDQLHHFLTAVDTAGRVPEMDVLQLAHTFELVADGAFTEEFVPVADGAAASCSSSSAAAAQTTSVYPRLVPSIHESNKLTEKFVENNDSDKNKKVSYWCVPEEKGIGRAKTLNKQISNLSSVVSSIPAEVSLCVNMPIFLLAGAMLMPMSSSNNNGEQYSSSRPCATTVPQFGTVVGFTTQLSSTAIHSLLRKAHNEEKKSRLSDDNSSDTAAAAAKAVEEDFDDILAKFLERVECELPVVSLEEDAQQGQYVVLPAVSSWPIGTDKLGPETKVTTNLQRRQQQQQLLSSPPASPPSPASSPSAVNFTTAKVKMPSWLAAGAAVAAQDGDGGSTAASSTTASSNSSGQTSSLAGRMKQEQDKAKQAAAKAAEKQEKLKQRWAAIHEREKNVVVRTCFLPVFSSVAVGAGFRLGTEKDVLALKMATRRMLRQRFRGEQQQNGVDSGSSLPPAALSSSSSYTLSGWLSRDASALYRGILHLHEAAFSYQGSFVYDRVVERADCEAVFSSAVGAMLRELRGDLVAATRTRGDFSAWLARHVQNKAAEITIDDNAPASSFGPAPIHLLHRDFQQKQQQQQHQGDKKNGAQIVHLEGAEQIDGQSAAWSMSMMKSNSSSVVGEGHNDDGSTEAQEAMAMNPGSSGYFVLPSADDDVQQQERSDSLSSPLSSSSTDPAASTSSHHQQQQQQQQSPSSSSSSYSAGWLTGTNSSGLFPHVIRTTGGLNANSATGQQKKWQEHQYHQERNEALMRREATPFATPMSSMSSLVDAADEMNDAIAAVGSPTATMMKAQDGKHMVCSTSSFPSSSSASSSPSSLVPADSMGNNTADAAPALVPTADDDQQQRQQQLLQQEDEQHTLEQETSVLIFENAVSVKRPEIKGTEVIFAPRAVKGALRRRNAESRNAEKRSVQWQSGIAEPTLEEAAARKRALLRQQQQRCMSGGVAEGGDDQSAASSSSSGTPLASSSSLSYSLPSSLATRLVTAIASAVGVGGTNSSAADQQRIANIVGTGLAVGCVAAGIAAGVAVVVRLRNGGQQQNV